MKNLTNLLKNLNFSVVAMALIICWGNAQATETSNYHLSGGEVNFNVGVSISVLNIHGSAKIHDGKVEAIRNERELLLRSLNLKFLAKDMTTGMKVRDGHMVERVFTDAGGKVPEIRMAGRDIHCPAKGSSYQCRVPLNVSLRGQEGKVEIDATISFNGNGQMKVRFDGYLDISKFGVKKISQFGIAVKNQVKIYTKGTTFSATAGSSLALLKEKSLRLAKTKSRH